MPKVTEDVQATDLVYCRLLIKAFNMRTKLFTLLGMFLAVTSQAQFIQQLTVVPANPTTTDYVHVIVDAGFPSGSCDEHSQMGGFVNASRYDASTLHCLGMLSFICYDADTFDLGVLTAGNYTFFVTVDAGGLPAPCTPGIVPGAFDSILFSVTSATGISDPENPEFSVRPNPATDFLQISAALAYGELFCYDAQGRLLWTRSVTDSQRISLTGMDKGMYYLQFVSEGTRSSLVKFIKAN